MKDGGAGAGAGRTGSRSVTADYVTGTEIWVDAALSLLVG